MAFHLLPAALLTRGAQHGLSMYRCCLLRLSSAVQLNSYASFHRSTATDTTGHSRDTDTTGHSAVPSVYFEGLPIITSSQRLYSTSVQINSVPPAASDELILSSSCIDRIRQLNAESVNDENDSSTEDSSSFLRIVVEGGGCSGFQYKFELDHKLQSDDRCFGPPDARVVIDELSLSLVKGSTVEYHSELIRAAFRIVDNPQSETGCSCGASFSVKL